MYVLAAIMVAVGLPLGFYSLLENGPTDIIGWVLFGLFLVGLVTMVRLTSFRRKNKF